MHVIGEVQVIPIGKGVSVRREVETALGILEASGLKLEHHAMGTNVEGDLDAVFSAVKRIHETLHAQGVKRLSTAIKIGTRVDKVQTMEGKKIR